MFRKRRVLEDRIKELEIMVDCLNDDYDQLHSLMCKLRDEYMKALERCVDLNNRTHCTILGVKHKN